MPYSAPTTITTGQLVTASLMNTDWAGNIAFLANPPACRVYNNASISHATSGNWQTVTFNSERYDTATMHDTVSNTSRITVPVDGLYLITGHIEFAANATGVRGIQILFNGTGTSVAGAYYPTTGGIVGTGLSIATVYKFAATNYVELQGYQTSGGALVINSTAASTPEFSVTWIGLG